MAIEPIKSNHALIRRVEERFSIDMKHDKKCFFGTYQVWHGEALVFQVEFGGMPVYETMDFVRFMKDHLPNNNVVYGHFKLELDLDRETCIRNELSALWSSLHYCHVYENERSDD